MFGLCLALVAETCAQVVPERSAVLTVDLSKAQIERSTWFGTKFLIAPIALTLDPHPDPEQRDRERLELLAGYLGIVLLGGAALDTFFVQSTWSFHAAINEIEGPPARRVLVLIGQNSNYRVDEIAKAFRLKGSEVTALSVGSRAQFLEILTKLAAEGRTFDRIDLMFHGRPGRISVGTDQISKSD